jgi:hypothetical protein
MSAPDGTNPRTSRKSFLWFKSLPMSDIGSHTCILAGNHIARGNHRIAPGESGSIIRQVYLSLPAREPSRLSWVLWFVEPALMELVLLCGQCVAR